MRELAEQGTTLLILADGTAHLAALCDVIYTMNRGKIVEVYKPQEDQDIKLPFKIPVRMEDKIVLVNPPSPPENRVSRGLMGGFGMAVNPGLLILKELEISGAYATTHGELQQAFELLLSGAMRPWVSEVLPLADACRFLEREAAALDAAQDELTSQLAEVESRELANIENALKRMREGEYLTGLLYVETQGREMHEINHTVDAPLNALAYEDLCPGAGAMGDILARYR